MSHQALNNDYPAESMTGMSAVLTEHSLSSWSDAVTQVFPASTSDEAAAENS